MGECGCGDFHYSTARKIGGNTLAVQIYDGCPYCDTPVGVILHLMNKQDCKDWQVKSDGELKAGDMDNCQLNVPIIDPEQLAEAATSAEFTSMCGEVALSDYESLKELIEDVGLPLLQVAIQLTAAKYRPPAPPQEEPAPAPAKATEPRESKPDPKVLEALEAVNNPNQQKFNLVVGEAANE